MALTLPLTPEQDAALAELATLQGVSKADALILAFEDKLARLREQSEILRYAAEEAEHYGTLLDRLGQ
jgi:hypothetical protein